MRSFLTLLLVIFTGHLWVLGQQYDRDLSHTIDNLLLDSRFQEAIDLINATAHASVLFENKKAEALTRLGDLEEAESLLKKIQTTLLAQPDAFLQAVTDANVGFLQLNQGRNDRAEASLLKAIEGFERSAKADSPENAQALSNLGLVYMTQGKYSQAQAHMHRALSVREKSPHAGPELIAATYNDLGLVYNQTDKEKALEYFEKAQGMYAKLYGNQHPKIAIANINIGILYRDLELIGDAVNNFENALKIWNSIYREPHPAKAIALYNLGQTYLQLNDQKAAMAYYEQAKKMYEDCFGPHHPEVASVLNAIGNLHLAASRFTEALASYQQSLQANVPDFNEDDPRRNPPLRHYYHGIRLLHTLLFKAEAFESRYLRKSLRFDDLRESLRILTLCDSLIDHLRQHSTNESDKLLVGAMANDVYADGVRIAHEAGMNAVNKEPYFRKAFYFAEKSKGAVLLESITESNARSFAGIPDHLLEEEKNLRSSLALISQRLAQKPSPEEEDLLRESSFTLKRQYDAFIKTLEDQFPSYFNLKFNSAAPAIEDLQGRLDGKTALISYFIDEKNNQLYIFLIRRHHYRVTQRALTTDFDKYLRGLRNSLYFNEFYTYKKSAAALGEILIPPIPSSVSELVIIPAGKLSVIPFETLLTDAADDASDYVLMPCLLKRFAIRYELSAGLILQKPAKANASASPSIFLCAPVNFPDNTLLANLPGTEREVDEISQLFIKNNLSTSAYTHRKADENSIKTIPLKNYQFLHFATHGIVDESSPELSRIFLQPDGAEDGYLFAGEIYNLQLNADLVTLSACQTGLGKIQKGEGVIGLSRALVYAGARNTVVSFWNVADESTAVLMKKFYLNVIEGGEKNFSEALRDAKLELLQNGQYASPYYWAPFVLIGF